MRADRLVATLLVLQARGRVTAAELAEEFEVSRATARRDLEALSASGVPVYAQRGRGGGWSLLGGARTDLSGLTANEARALFLLVGPAAAASEEAKAALRKLVRALPRSFRSEAEAAAGATMIDSSRWGEAARPRPEIADALQDAVIRRRKVRLTYAGRSRERTERLVDPWGLVEKGGLWYLIAATEGGRRTFRLDRVVAAASTEEPAERPGGATLRAAWQEVVGEIERRRSRTWATVVVDSGLAPVLRGQFGRHCRVEAEREDGRSRVRVGAPTPLDIARHLAGWGAEVDVVEPRSVREELARIGGELVERHASPESGGLRC